MENRKILKSGEFLISEVDPNDVFIPEEYDEEQKMIAQTCKDFLEAEVYPELDNLDKGDRELMLKILKSSGELGLMGISIPEEFGGFGQSFVTQMLAAETIGAAYSFSVAFMAHCGIGTLPIMYFGSYEQRTKYVTALATGDMKGPTASLNRVPVVMPTQVKQAPPSRKMVNSISLMVRKCGSPMPVLPMFRQCLQRLITTGY